MTNLKLIFSLLYLSIGVVSFCQESILVPAGENPTQLLPRSIRFLNQSFNEGHLIFLNDSETETYKLNIDLYKECIVYVNKTSDTTLIIHDLNVKRVKIGQEEFIHIHKTGFLKVLAANSMYTLVSRTRLLGKEIQEQVNIGYGTVPARTVTSSVKSNRVLNDTRYQREVDWLLLDQRGSILKADKRNFLKMFHEDEDQIRAFIKSEKIDYDNEKDLIKLFLSCITSHFQKG